MPLSLFKFFFYSRTRPSFDRILFVELGGLGDVIMATPAIALVKKKKPNSYIICLCSPAGSIAIKNNNLIDEIVVLAPPIWYYSNTRSSFITLLKTFNDFIKAIKKIGAGTVISFRDTAYQFDHLVFFLAGVRNSIGFADKGFGYFLSIPAEANRAIPIPFRKIALVRNWLKIALDFPIDTTPIFCPEKLEIKNVDEMFSSIGLPKNNKIIVINPGAQHNFLWPVSHYVKVCELIHQRYPFTKILFLGTVAHTSLIEEIQIKLPVKTYSLVGKTNLDQLYGILNRVALLLTVDTGIRHIANTIGLPVIVLRHGADRIASFGKYVGTENVLSSNVPCSPCGKSICPLGSLACMANINPVAVFKEIVNYLS